VSRPSGRCSARKAGDEKDFEAAPGPVAGDAGAVDPPADNEQIEGDRIGHPERIRIEEDVTGAG
jgi:hypothetical protein